MSEALIDPELDVVAAEVNKDIREGNGAKHFERELDEIFSTQGSARVKDYEQPGVAEGLRRFSNAFRAGLDEQIRPAGLRCRYVIPDGKGEGFHIQFLDRDRRTFDVAYSFDEGMAAAARAGEKDMGREMMHEVCKKVLNARAHYFARMH